MFSHCADCESSSAIHISTWIDTILERLLPTPPRLNYRLENHLNRTFLRVLTMLRIGEVTDAYDLYALPPRLSYFVEAATAQGIKCSVFKIGSRYTEHLIMHHGGKRYYFQAYPTASHFDGPFAQLTNDKVATKEHMLLGNFPTPRGGAYCFWQKERALRKAVRDIGFPLVVKPAHGTFARHVTTDIKDTAALRAAIDHALAYQPRFLIEQYIPLTSVLRVTVIDFHVIAVGRQIPAEIVGNGRDTIAVLIESKNVERRSAIAREPRMFVGEIPVEPMLMQTSLENVPRDGEVVQIYRYPFVRLGADVIDETSKMHQANTLLCERLARHFDIRCAGIDILVADATVPWSDDSWNVLEINDLPTIELHQERNAEGKHGVAEALVDVFLRYYALPSDR